MNKSYIRQDNKLAVAHFKKLGCRLVPGYNTSSWYEGDNLKVPDLFEDICEVCGSL